MPASAVRSGATVGPEEPAPGTRGELSQHPDSDVTPKPRLYFLSARRFLIRDNDCIFSARLIEAIGHLGLESKPTTYRSPWQNGTAERWVGTVRRELLDHVIVLDKRHLRRLLREYVDYYNDERVYASLRDSPAGRPAEVRPSLDARIVGLPRVGGLHHRYAWQEAA